MMMMRMMVMITMMIKKKTVGYRLSFFDSCRLMPGKLSDLVDNLSEIHDKECERSMKRKCEFIGFKNNRLNYKCKK